MLREVLPEDLPILFENQRDPDAVRMAATHPRDHETFMEHWKTNVIGNASVVARTVVHEGEVAGTANTFERDGRRLVGYFFGKNYWGKGIATQAVRDLLAVDTSRPLFAFVAKHNRGSIRVLEKNGFVQIEELPNRLNDGITDVLLKLA
jgi:RimJ/RimL family protein N-acetyltransferase